MRGTKNIKVYIQLAALIIISVVSSCSPSTIKQVEPLGEPTNILSQQESVKACLIEMWDAIEKEDIERYASYIHPDFTQFGETDPTLAIGKQAEVNGVKDWLKNSSNIHTEMEEPRVTIKGEVAWITYYWKDHGMTRGEPFTSRGKSTRIFVKEQEKWLCIHGHYTLLP